MFLDEFCIICYYCNIKEQKKKDVPCVINIIVQYFTCLLTLSKANIQMSSNL